MKCEFHPEQDCVYECKKCGVSLCRNCKPVSFQGKVLCSSCCELEEQKFHQIEQKRPLYKSLGKLFIFFASLLLLGLPFYFFYFCPREVKVSLDDRDRLEFYLNLAYDSGKNSPVYERQMDNIRRLNMKYRHVIKFLNAAEKFIDKKEYLEAIGQYEKVKKMLPDWDRIYIFISHCYRELGNPEQSKSELKQAIELNPEGSRGYVLLGELLATQKMWDEAILQYSKALFIERDNGEILLALAELYLKKKRIAKAREFRERARELGIDTEKVDALFQEIL